MPNSAFTHRELREKRKRDEEWRRQREAERAAAAQAVSLRRDAASQRTGEPEPYDVRENIERLLSPEREHQEKLARLREATLNTIANIMKTHPRLLVMPMPGTSINASEELVQDPENPGTWCRVRKPDRFAHQPTEFDLRQLSLERQRFIEALALAKTPELAPDLETLQEVRACMRGLQLSPSSRIVELTKDRDGLIAHIVVENS
jgi:hypothetical protein